MKKRQTFSKENLKVLGIVIRSKRIEKELSLRDLSAITSISHTLISNIEKGKQTPNQDTLKDIMNALDLEFHTDEETMTEMTELSLKLISFLSQFEYEQAKIIMDKLTEKEKTYLSSPQVVNYMIVKYLFIAVTNVEDTDINHVLEHYSNVVEFFTDLQTQAYYFVKGLNHLNNEYFNKALESFEQALSIGDKAYDVFIKEYMIITMVRQFKFMDSFRVANDIISEYEKRTIYVRAMRVKLQIARVYLVINKFDDMNELLNQVYNFASKFEVLSLLEEVLLLRAAVAIRHNDLDSAEQIIAEMPFQKSISTALYKFRVTYNKGEITALEKLYYEVMTYPEVLKHYKLPNYFTMLAMYKVPSLMNEEKYITIANKLVEDAIERNDQEFIGLAYNYIFEFYYSKRQYKKATDVAQNFLQHKKLLRKL